MGLSSLWIHQRYTPRVWLNDSWQMGCDIAACVASNVPTLKCQFYLSYEIDGGLSFTYHAGIKLSGMPQRTSANGLPSGPGGPRPLR